MYSVVVVTSGACIGCLSEELNVESAESLVIAVGLCGFDFSNRPLLFDLLSYCLEMEVFQIFLIKYKQMMQA